MAEQTGTTTSLSLLATLKRSPGYRWLWPQWHMAGSRTVVHQDPQVLLCRADSQEVSPQPVLVHGAVPSQMLNPALAFVEFQKVPLCPSLQPVQILLDGSTALQGIGYSSQFCIISKLAEQALCPFIQVIHELVNTGPSIDSWGTPLVAGLQLDSVPLITSLIIHL